MQRKAFQVVMRRTETRISEQTVTVHAETEADARVLAKYEETPFYSWQAAGATAERVDIASVKVADDPLTHYENLAQRAAHQVAASDCRN
ncbi:hypothetical protein RA224_12885 [Achromobacter aegrifaciens]|uniref:hypothetical protein n=1 Tax=Achromobacter aegrifaciens TaxID=1287736 RepID=UPI0027BACC75|nr:hypothetical protein [Achromobacter aegrifaciens]WLW64280.1 hypothetical protein RA224_12885 [Achromobacter aegrifaciens]